MDIDSVTHPEMVNKLCKSAQEILGTMDPSRCHNMHMVFGIVGEVGELYEAFLPHLAKERSPDRTHVCEELGDIEFYMEGLRQNLSIERVAITEAPFYTVGKSLAGLTIAACELVDVVKKQIIYDQELDTAKVQDLLIQIDSQLLPLTLFVSLDRATVLTGNKRKLSKRYEGFQYSNQAAKARADKQE